jgi:hypothetical protein
MVWFRENWYEEVLRQLRQGLAKCRAVAFENRANVTDTAVTPHTLNFVCKLVSTFGVGVENSAASVVTSTFSSAASESLARRAQATAQDPIFQRIYCWLWFQVGHRNITPLLSSQKYSNCIRDRNVVDEARWVFCNCEEWQEIKKNVQYVRIRNNKIVTHAYFFKQNFNAQQCLSSNDGNFCKTDCPEASTSRSVDCSSYLNINGSVICSWDLVCIFLGVM